MGNIVDSIVGSIVGAFVGAIVVIMAPIASAQAEECPPSSDYYPAQVERVIDADTLLLQGGERVRLIGIDAPELGYNGQPDEPFARQGKHRLGSLLEQSNRQVLIQEGRENRDRHQRLLAYVFLRDKTNVQQLLLEEGLAMQVFLAPNIEFADCLRSSERKAKLASSGIWSLEEYQLGIDSHSIPDDVKGAVIVQGRVERVGFSKHTIWINLEGRLVIQVAKKYRSSFPLQFEALKGQKVRVRGWISEDNARLHRWRIPINHPNALEVL